MSLHSNVRHIGSSDLNHHHSVSDGALSYSGSPSDFLQARRWTPCVHRYDLGEFSTPAGGNIILHYLITVIQSCKTLADYSFFSPFR